MPKNNKEDLIKKYTVSIDEAIAINPKKIRRGLSRVFFRTIHKHKDFIRKIEVDAFQRETERDKAKKDLKKREKERKKREKELLNHKLREDYILDISDDDIVALSKTFHYRINDIRRILGKTIRVSDKDKSIKGLLRNKLSNIISGEDKKKDDKDE